MYIYYVYEDPQGGKIMDEKEKYGIEEEIANEVGEDTTKYGEFISSYFAWVSLPEQKDKVEKLEDATKKRKKEKK